MPRVVSKTDGASLHYRDYVPSSGASAFLPQDERNAPGKPSLLFTAAWPFSSSMYDHIMLPLCESYGFRCIGIDRRGFGKSEWRGADQSLADIDYDTLADDLVQIWQKYEGHREQGFVGIGASLGCGELLLALQKNPSMLATCRGLIFLGPSLQIPMQTATKSSGPPREFWDALLERLRGDRWHNIASALPYIWGEQGSNLLSAAESARYEAIARESDPIGLERTVQIFLDRDFTEFLRRDGHIFNFPILILHGNADAANPVEAGPKFVQANVPNANIIVYETAAHGIAATHKQQCLIDITKFLKELL